MELPKGLQGLGKFDVKWGDLGKIPKFGRGQGKKSKKKKQKNPRKNGENLNFWGVKNGKKMFDFF